MSGPEPIFDPVDPDVDLRVAAERAEVRPHEWPVLLAVGLGGVLGAEARYGVDRLLPPRPDAFPWATVLINASGCLLLGALMVVLLERVTAHRLARPFLGVGILGGYTTFSTFAVDADHLIDAGRPLVALGYVVATLVAGALAVRIGTLLVRRWWR